MLALKSAITVEAYLREVEVSRIRPNSASEVDGVWCGLDRAIADVSSSAVMDPALRVIFFSK